MHIEGNATILAFGVFRGTVLLDTQWTTKLSLGQGYHTLTLDKVLPSKSKNRLIYTM